MKISKVIICLYAFFTKRRSTMLFIFMSAVLSVLDASLGLIAICFNQKKYEVIMNRDQVSILMDYEVWLWDCFTRVN